MNNGYKIAMLYENINVYQVDREEDFTFDEWSFHRIGNKFAIQSSYYKDTFIDANS